jgi:pyridoxine 5-phosphate synthase
MGKMEKIRLGINVDHVATVRQARGTTYPDPVEAALAAAAAGADSITVHLREDRRHIQDHDVARLLKVSRVPVNLEMAVTGEMVDIACALKPPFACLVPERRQEVTTEGGLDVVRHFKATASACARLARAGVRVALFIDADEKQLFKAHRTGAPHLEIHTGTYADAKGPARRIELRRIARFAHAARRSGFEIHAGHGLTLDNVGAIAALPDIVELNIGHSVVARALLVGMPAAVREMRRAMNRGRG